MLLLQAEIDKFVYRVASDKKHDLTGLGLGNSVNSVLRLQVVHQVERPIEVDCDIRLGQREPFARSGRVGDEETNFRVSL